MRGLRSTGAIVALMATTALATPALAQNAGGESQPSQRQELDENGVNPATGGQVAYVTDLSIGPSGPGGLRLVRGRGHGANPSSMSFLISGEPATQLYVSAGLKGITFDKVGSSYIPNDGSGATLVQNSSTQWTLMLEDGTVVVYNQQTIQDSQYDGRGTSVTYPTGETLTLAYTNASWCANIQCTSIAYGTRLQGVASSLGYLFHYDYARDLPPELPGQAFNWKQLEAVQAINTTIDPCAPADLTCTTTQSWPTVGYTTTGGVTDPAGNTWTYTGSTTQFKIRRPGSGTDNIVYNIDTATQRTTSVVRDGMTWTYGWSLAGNLLTMTRTDPLTHVLTVVSDTTVGLPKTITDELTPGRVTTNVYNSSGQRTKTTFPEGNFVQYTFGARGNVTQVKRVAKTGTGLADIITSATYPSGCGNPKSCNSPTTTTDARGNVTNYTYNTNGDPLTITSPAPSVGAVRPQIRYAYANVTTPGGAVSQLQSVSQCQTLASCTGAADETKVSYSWSNQLILTSVTQANGTGTLSAVTTITNDNVGNPKTIDGPLPGTADTTNLRYDNARRRVGTISPDPDGVGPLKLRAVKTAYHPTGGVQTIQAGTVNGITDPDWAAMTVLETQAIGYDSAARPATFTIAGSDGVVQALAQQSYDGEGRPDCFTIRMNSATFGSPPAACLLGAEGSFGKDRITKTIYDAANQVTQQQVAFATPEVANERTLTYTNNGRLATLTDAEVNKTSYIYDGHDRLSQTQMPSPTKGSGTSSTTDYEQLTYDAASNVTSRRLRDTTSIAFAYDNLNRATLKNLPGAEPDVTYAYDALSRLTSAAQTGNSLSFTYDALSRNLTQVGPQGTVASQWDLAGRRTKLTYPGAGLFVTYDYLVTGETTAIRENGAASGVGVLATYAYDDLGRRTSLIFGNGVVQATAFDPVSRLASLTNDLAGTGNDLSQTLAYNPASQIASTVRTGDAYAWTGHFNQNVTGTANGLNQLTSVGPKSLTHDARGNVTAFGTRSFTYSRENLLATGPNGTTLSYDPMARLQQIVSGGATTKLAYDGLDRIAEYDGSSNLLRRTAHGPNIDEPLVWYEGTGTTDRRFLSSDERGSIISVTDSAGALLGINRYDEYGMPQSTNLGAFGYTGQAWLPTIGVWYYKARDYDPELGRFLQTDPIGYAGGINLYAYVGNDPVNFIDPLGLDGEDIVVQGLKFCQKYPAACIGYAGAREAIRELSKSLNQAILNKAERTIKDKLAELGKTAFCAIASFNFGVDAGVFKGLGVRFNAGVTYNTGTGQVFKNLTFSGGLGYGTGGSGGLAAQTTATGGGSYGSVDSLLSVGSGLLGGSASYSWLNVSRGRSSSGSGFSGSVGLAKAYGGNYAAPLVVSLNTGGLVGTVGTPCD